MPDKLIRVLRRNPVRLKRFLGKIRKVIRYDHPSLTTNSRRQHMSVMRIGQLQLIDETFVSRHQIIRHGQVHQLPRALELLGFQVGTSFDNRSRPFSMNLFGPSRAKKLGQRETQQQIPQGCRM